MKPDMPEPDAPEPDALIRAKHALRAEVLREREALGEDARKSLSVGILAHIRSLPAYRSAEVVLAYHGFGSELDTHPFLRSVLDDGKILALPRVVRDEVGSRLELHTVSNLEDDLRPGVWGILEPDERLPRLEVSDVDFVLTPGVAFDRDGGRLGHGGGFYDKLLANLEVRPYLVAGAFEAQIVDEVPREPHDVVVDLVITEAFTPETGSRW